MNKQLSIPSDFKLEKTANLKAANNREYGWNLTNTLVNRAHALGYYGQGVKIAIADTGIKEHIDLPKFKYKNYTQEDQDLVHMHGIHTAGIMASQGIYLKGIAPKARYFMGKVLDMQGNGEFSFLVSFINDAIEWGANVINLSLGASHKVYDKEVKKAISRAFSKGIIIVASSGNTSIGRVGFPAYLEDVISVGATNSTDKLASFSNYGFQLDLVAPGVRIISTVDNNEYKEASGTSMSAPHVSGIIALFIQMIQQKINKQPTVTQIYNILYKSTKDIMNKGKDPYSGFGLVQAIQENNNTENKECTNIIQKILLLLKKIF